MTRPELNTILQGDCLSIMRGWPGGLVQTCVTSPPYWGLRDYGMAGQLGLENTPQEYVEKMVAVFREVRRVLRDDGTLWLNLGDCYFTTPAGNKPGTLKSCSGLPNTAENLEKRKSQYSEYRAFPGLKKKDIVGIPWSVAFALRSDGWYLRQDIIWHKPNPMPESVTDRCTKAHEYIFMLSKSEQYFYDHDAIKEEQITPWDCKASQSFGAKGGKAEIVYGAKVSGDNWEPSGFRNKRDVWTICTKPYSEAHFATFPEDLIVPCILAGCPEGGTVLDPFMGAGTVAKVSLRANRNFLGCELNKKYIDIANARIDAERSQGKLF